MSEKEIELTLRIGMRTAIGCGQLLIRQNVDPRSKPIDAVIGSTLDSVIAWFEKQGYISKVEGDLEHTFVQMFGRREEDTHSLDFQALGDKLRDNYELIEEAKSAVASRVLEDQISKTVRSTDPIETADLTKKSLDLRTVNRMSLENLARLAPKDPLIEQCTKGVVEEYYKWAVEIVYTQLSLELWGTEPAIQAVEDLCQRHERWLAENSEPPEYYGEPLPSVEERNEKITPR